MKVFEVKTKCLSMSELCVHKNSKIELLWLLLVEKESGVNVLGNRQEEDFRLASLQN